MPRCSRLAANAARGAIHPEHKNGTQIGKRYVNADGSLELLCTKPGEGSLAAGGAAAQAEGSEGAPVLGLNERRTP